MTMNKKNIRIGFVGCGRIFSKHADAIKNIPEMELFALCDENAAALAAAKQTFPEAITYTSFTELLSNQTISVIVIATPSGLHAEMACLALQAGKDVILEKPIALTTEQAQKIIAAEQSTNHRVCVVLQNRFNKAVQLVKQRSGELGALKYISGNVFWYRPQSYYEDGWHGTKQFDGGALMNQGTHYVDMLLYLSGKKVETLSAFGGTFGHEMECEDVVTINIKFSDGTLGNLQVNTITYPQNIEGSITLFYEQATIKIGGTALNEITYWQGNGADGIEQLEKGEQIDNIYGKGHNYFYEEFLKYDRKGAKEVPIALTDGYDVLQFVEKVYESMQTGKLVQFKD
jgi:UDP-N-acetyl-2-amino-2-deoxyglucuronate dehydrogenase